MTYEDYSTLFAQIESILNSRPLTPLTVDPNDCETLTPAHFLIGRSFTSLLDLNIRDVPVQPMVQHFWNQWSRGYLSELQQRSKWKNNAIDLRVKL